MAGIVLAVVGVVVLIVAVVALRDPKSDSPHNTGASVAISQTPSGSSRPASRTSAPPATGPTSAPPVSLSGTGAPSSATSGPQAVPLVVLNNTTVSGLAKSAARRFENGGWTVTSFANYTNDIASTCAYYDPDSPGAQAAAQALQAQYPTIKRVEPKFAELPSGPVVVVLTPDYQSD